MQEEEVKAVVAENLIALRRKKQWTQAELAEKLNYSDKAVSKWERAESLPDVVILKRIADLFEVSVDFLLEKEHESPVPLSKRKHRNRALITAISAMTVWLIACIVYFSLRVAGAAMPWSWLSFVGAVPVCCVVLLVFSAMWWGKRWLFTTVSVLIWSLLALAFFLVLLAAERQLWLIFLIGIPAQVIVLLWAGLRRE